MDDVRASEGLPIDARLEKQRFGAFFPYLKIQFAVHGNVKSPPAMGTRGFDFNGKPLSSEAPLHEGRSESIFCSSPMRAFSRAEFQAMRRGLGGDRKGPADFTGLIADQEKEMTFEVLHNGMNRCNGESQCSC
jgi:hypothetical protein